MQQRIGRAALDAGDAAAYRREFGGVTVGGGKRRRQRARLALKAVIAAWRARRAGQ